MSSIRYYQPFQMGVGSGIPKPKITVVDILGRKGKL